MTFAERLERPIQTDDDFAEYVKSLYDEWAGREQTGYPTAERLGAYIKEIRRDLPPQFCAGKLESPVALVSLNPHAGGKGSAEEVEHKQFFSTWDDYWLYWQNFAHERYGTDGAVAKHYAKRAQKPPKSSFDEKLLRFLAAGAGIDAGETSLAHMDALHLELIPLASSEFDIKAKDPYIRQYAERIVDALALHERTIIIVLNGAVLNILKSFDKLSYALDVLEERSFRVNKTDGTPCDWQSSVGRYELRRADGKTLRLVAAPTFARRGVPLANYGASLFTAEEKQAIKNMLSKK